MKRLLGRIIVWCITPFVNGTLKRIEAGKPEWRDVMITALVNPVLCFHTMLVYANRSDHD